MSALLSDTEAEGRTAEIFAEMRHQFGTVPNFFRAQAAVSEDWLGLNWQRWQVIMGRDGSLDSKTKELIALAVSLVKNCDYCAVSHEGAARRAGANDHEIGELRQIVELFCSFTNIAESLRVPLDNVSRS